MGKDSKKQILVRAKALFDGVSERKDLTVVIENGRITDIAKLRSAAHYEGIVTPAFIDAHSHIGMAREGEPGAESETNEILQQIQPLTNPLNSIYFDDRAFRDAIDFGVLYSCVIPGSGNLFGGQAKVIRHNAKHAGEALVSDYGYKMALGYNPRSTQSWKGDRPNTRMGLYALLEKKFDEVLAKAKKARIVSERKAYECKRKRAKKEFSEKEFREEKKRIEQEEQLALNTEEALILDALSGKKPIKVHVHKEDDVLYLIHLKNKYGLYVTAEHTGDVFHKEIFNLLAREDISIVYGPLGSFAYKVELQHAYYQNAKLIMDSKANFGLMTDHPVISVCALRDSLKFFLIQGMSYVDALNLITRKNAEILNLGAERGVLTVGAYADLLVWKNDPLHLASIPQVVMGEGRVLVSR